MNARGHTLAEMLVVLAILGLVAALVIPTAAPASSFRADAAAQEVAQALRFAQSEALRTGQYYLVRCDVAAGSVTVARLDINATPPAPDPAFPVLHPLDKKDYKIVFNPASTTSGVSIASCAFGYADGSSGVPQIEFGGDGAPVNLLGSSGAAVKAMNGTGQITLAAGPVSRTVQVAAVTGRVTLAP